MHVSKDEVIQICSEETSIADLRVLAAALESSKQGLIILDENLRVVHTNRKLWEVLGISKDTSVKQFSINHLLGASTVLDVKSLEWLNAVWAKPSSASEDLDIAKSLAVGDGSRTLHFENRRIGPRHSVATFEDITSRREQEIRVSEAALCDALTGLANRRHFEQALTESFNSNSEGSLTVLFVDLDRFKAVNDTLGHAIGDEVLRIVSQRLKSIVRSTDIIARLGGDEFAILAVPALSNEDASGIATRVVDLLQRTYLVSGQVVNIGASVGIASAPEDAADPPTLLQCADLALYHSKALGRGTFHFFDQSMQTRALERRNLELDLRKALALRQFEIHYLPRIEVGSGHLLGLEAVLRWRHPEKGLLFPEAFLPTAEEIGLLVPIGDWLIRTACRQASRTGSGLIMIVSTFGQQFEDGHLAESIRRCLTSTALDGSKLEVQITEDVLLRNKTMVVHTLHELRKLKVRIAMDDFGTGYASISQLVSFPFDRIKIGQSLLAERSNASNRAIVCAVAALGASLGVATMASGVETPELLAQLRADGCGSVRGYQPTQTIAPNELDKFLTEISVTQSIPNLVAQ